MKTPKPRAFPNGNATSVTKSTKNILYKAGMSLREEYLPSIGSVTNTIKR